MPHAITVKTILNKTRRRDPWFLDDYTINPYSGCSFNCLYCYIRGSKYGENMAEKTSVKANALELLDKQLALRARKGQYGIIVLSSATDPYLQFEEETLLTRQILEIISHYRFPVHIITKSNLVLRDLDLLREIETRAILPKDLENALQRKVLLTFSFSTVDPVIGGIFEPGAPSPELRLKALETVVNSGFSSGVSLMPLLPYISDTGEHLEQMFNAFKAAGSHYVFPASITLFGKESSDSKPLIMRAVEKHYPHLADKYKRFFGNSDEPPEFYKKAFYAKMKELGKKYDLKDRIL